MINSIPMESVLYLGDLDIKKRHLFLVALHINPVPRVHRLSRRFTNNVVVDEPEDMTIKAPEISFYMHMHMEPICRSFLGSDI